MRRLVITLFLAETLLLSWTSTAQQGSAYATFGKGATIKGRIGEPLVPEVLPGETIQVPAGSFLVLYPTPIGRQERIITSENTEVQYLTDKIDLAYGTARVENTDRIGARVHGDSLTPTMKNTTYQVSWIRGTGIVVVYEGQIEITKCRKRYLVPANQVGEFTERACAVGVYGKSAWTTGRGLEFGSAIVAAPAICTTFKCMDVILPPRPSVSAEGKR